MNDHDTKTRGWPDGDLVRAPTSPQAIELAKKYPTNFKPKPKPPAVCALQVGDRKYTTRQLEHIGDRVFALAACEMVHEVTGENQKLYFMYAGQLCSNENLTICGRYGQAKLTEVEIGHIYAEKGLVAALNTAKLLLADSHEWKHFLKACKNPDAIAAWDDPK